MEPTEKIYGIHWETETELPLWQLTSHDWLRVDITRDFDAKFRLVAYAPLLEGTANALRARMTNVEKDEYWEPTIEATCFGGTGSLFGSKRDIFKYISPPGDDFVYGWRVSNCARVSPGFMRHVSKKYSSDNANAALVRHPKEAYQVQFCGVPWRIFKKYWRKPINLDRKFHNRGTSKWSKRYSTVHGHPAINVLDFDMTLLKQERCFFADFSGMYLEKERHTDADLTKWMLQHSRAFRVLSDEDSPFVRSDTEFLFTMDWM
jgi:hypothetical protein